MFLVARINDSSLNDFDVFFYAHFFEVHGRAQVDIWRVMPVVGQVF